MFLPLFLFVIGLRIKKMNPYLPLNEYIPDGEPRLFGDRVYVYGSHDLAGGEKGYCAGDYMVYSAHVTDLSNWRCDGVGFKRDDCPGLTDEDAMAAPDCVQGIDGAYYLYFNTNRQKICQIARSERPEGPFTYYGEVCMSDGSAYDEYKMFDPGVLVDNGHVYLYVGFCMPGPVPDKFKGMKSPFAKTSLGFELANDMKTIMKGPFPIIPGGNDTDDTSFVGHGFFEASSPRKINNRFVMVYSSEKKHELCYAVSKYPFAGYEYKGILISNCDIGYKGNTEPKMPYGNNHGGILQLDDRFFIFYHRQTHAIECCRQGCAQELELDDNGDFKQAEMTSGGIQGIIQGKGIINSTYCCGLISPEISDESLHEKEYRGRTEPHIYEDKASKEHYIKRIVKDTQITFKYFSLNDLNSIDIVVRGSGMCSACITIESGNEKVAVSKKEFCLTDKWESIRLDIDKPVNSEKSTITVSFDTDGALDFKEMELN